MKKIKLCSKAGKIVLIVVHKPGFLQFEQIGFRYMGHTGIEHSLPIMNVYEDTFQLWSQTGTGYTPTFGVAYGGLSGETFVKRPGE